MSVDKSQIDLLQLNAVDFSLSNSFFFHAWDLKAFQIYIS